MKPHQIKIFPEIVDYCPVFMFNQISKNKYYDNFFLDFTNCEEINSTGLTILLNNLLYFFNKSKNLISWNTNIQQYEDIYFKLKKLGFLNIIDKYFPNKTLFNNLLNEKDDSLKLNHKNNDGINLVSYPIYELKFDKFKSRRDALYPFREWLYQIFEEYSENYDFNFTQIISILNEIAKNSADHTSFNALFGLDIKFLKEDKLKISFSFNDLGAGIKQNIQNNLPDAIKKKRGKKYSLYEAYRDALTFGFTTKPESKENKGIGMTLIVEASKGINLKLSIFDAQSRGIINTIHETTHAALRKNFINININSAFFYYGELYINKII